MPRRIVTPENADIMLKFLEKAALDRRQILLEELDHIINSQPEEAPDWKDKLKAIELQMKAFGMMRPEGDPEAAKIHLTIEGLDKKQNDRGEWLSQNNPQLRPPNGRG